MVLQLVLKSKWSFKTARSSWQRKRKQNRNEVVMERKTGMALRKPSREPHEETNMGFNQAEELLKVMEECK